MKIPTSIKEVHCAHFRELLEVKSMGCGLSIFGSGEDAKLMRAVDKLTKGMVRVLGYYGDYHEELTRMEARITKFFEKKGKVFKYLYAIPTDDGYFLVATRVNTGWPYRRTG